MPKIEVKEIHPQTKLPLDLAVPIVNAAIEKYREKLERIAAAEENEPIMVEGITSADYQVQLMTDPKDVAKILLAWNYPIFNVIGEEAPQEMWDALGEHFGLATVCGVDL